MNRKQLFLLQMASLFFSALTFSNVLTGRLISVVSALALLIIVPLSVWGWRRIGAREQDMPPEQAALEAQAELEAHNIHPYTPREKSWLKGFAFFAGLMLLLIVWIQLGK